jgi:hypothetical protein
MEVCYAYPNSHHPDLTRYKSSYPAENNYIDETW